MRKQWFITLAVLIVLVVGVALLPQRSGTSDLVRYQTSFFDVFDTYSEVTVYAATETLAQAEADKAHAALVEYHQLYDIYNDYEGLANLKTVNDQAGAAPVAVDERIIGLLTYAKEMEQKTNGRMNIAMGSVLSIWHDYRTAGLADPESAALPSLAELQAAAEHTNIEDLIIDAEAGTVFLADPALQLDVGAIAKGYATEQVAQMLLADGVQNALLSIGGNVRAIGTKSDGSLWRVNIQNPDLTAENQSLFTLSLTNLSLVTSGSYQRYYTVDGKQYHHIIDPDTLFPAEYLWSVSVITEDSALADALSTALFTLPVEQGQALLANFDSVEALWVTPDGTETETDGFAALTASSTAGE